MSKKQKDDKWAKENGYTLQRDSCPDCIRRWSRGDTNSLGEVMFCSMAHAFEVSNLKKMEHYDSLRDKLIGAIDESIMDKDKAREIIREIEDRYY